MPSDSTAATATSRQGWLALAALILRILLWPLRRFLQFIFPPNELDGLSPAVTAKAAQAFKTYMTTRILSSLPMSSDELPWSTTGFVACRNEAARSNSLLLLYLHSPLHRDADAVAQKLCREPILAQLRQLVCLGMSIHTAQGLQLAQTLGACSFPYMVVLQQQQSMSSSSLMQSTGMGLLLKIQGPVLVQMTPSQLASKLQIVLQRQQWMQLEQETRRLQREQEAQLRAEQDAEYQATLAADQERQRQQMEREQEALRQEQERREAERRKEEDVLNRLVLARSLLRPEPAAGGGTRVRFQLPSGKRLDRSFESQEKVKSLRAYLTVYFHEQDMPEMINIGLSTNFPRKTFNDEQDNEMTLQEAGLAPQAVLMVQDLDA